MGRLILNEIEYSGTDGGVELTYAEYLALPEPAKHNGTTYYITDVNDDENGFQPVIYSKDEREIGVWADAKPLYQRTWTFSSAYTINANSWVTTSISNAGIEKCIECVGISPSGAAWGFLGATGDTGSYINILNIRQIAVEVKSLTLRYTKTTDTPGSGTWTPQGVPAVHYSTDEHVVGTWIDGKTVYEQTIIGNAISDTGINVLWERTDIDTIVEYNCIFLDDTNLEYNANYYYSTGAYFRVFIDTQSVWTNTKGIVCQRSSNQSINGTRLTVQYTKTS